MAKFSEVLKIINGRNQRAVENPSGKYPIYGSGGIMGYADDYICSANTVIIGRKGSINKPIFVETPFWNVDTAFGLSADTSKLYPKYLYYFCQNFDFEKLNTTVTIPSLTKANLLNIDIPLPELNEQRHIAAVLDKVTDLITQRRTQLDKLDLLVKSRFVEMFGDPEVNSFNLPSIPMTNLCEIIDGDRGSNYPKQEEFSSDGYCLFLNAKNVTNSGFCFNQCLYISKEKDSLMRKGKLQRGDIVLTTRGTIGNLAFYDNTIPYENVRINSGMVILRVHKEQITEIFFIEQSKMLLGLIKSKMASGSAQPQLPISTMKQIMMLVPPIEEQMNFNKIVAQTNTLKFCVTNSLNTLEKLKKSLMQKYFSKNKEVEL